MPLEPVTDASGRARYAHSIVRRATPWLCERQTRDFVLTYRTAAGEPATSTFTIRTPSCADRLRLTLPAHVAPGRNVRLTVRDTWATGDLKPWLCVRPPAGGRVACRNLTFAAGRDTVTTAFPASTRGRWRLQVATAHQSIRAAVAAGVAPRPEDVPALPRVLVTGDSMMQTLDTVLQDRLARQAALDSEIQVGSGFTKPLVVDWRMWPADQVARLRQRATVVFLGMNDDFEMTPADGTTAACCGADWTAEYARRAERAMRAYAADDRYVYWLTVPAPRDARRATATAAVNTALTRAAKRVPGARLIDAAAVFTPGGVYRDSMTRDGGEVRVRQQDGVHLTVRGAQIAAELVVPALQRDGVL